MAGKVISAEVPEELNERIAEFQQEGESRSAAIRRLCRKGLDQGPGDEIYAVVVTFAVAWIGVAVLTNNYTALYVESGLFHLLAVLWVGLPEVRERVNNLRD
jgi:hypothetical protein